MKKVIKKGKIAVLYSPGFGAGWYSWHSIEALFFDPKVVKMVENKADKFEIEKYCEKTYGDEAYFGGIDKLRIEWIPEGTRFIINEYDGNESIEILDDIKFLTA